MLDNCTEFFTVVVRSVEHTISQIRKLVYSTGHLTRNRRAGAGWISYLNMGAFSYANFSINTLVILNFPVDLSLRLSYSTLLTARFLTTLQYSMCPVLLYTWYTVPGELIRGQFSTFPVSCERGVRFDRH